jgi:Gluconate 2-dehydrogenase subunit 3
MAEAVDQENWIVDPGTQKRIAPMEQPGYYPGYSTLDQRQFWDAATRTEIERRVYEIPPIRFFLPEELPTITAVCNRVLPQDDRIPERRIAIVNYIDERLFLNRISGYRYEDMPSDQDAYRLGLRAIDDTALTIHGLRFVELDALKQEFILKSLHDGRKLAASGIWAKMSVRRFWELLVQDCVGAYYAHPWAWDEIGFGGPAYPRAYTRLEGGMPEPWEVDEKRYEWAGPPTAISDGYEESGTGGEQSHHGQGGTH